MFLIFNRREWKLFREHPDKNYYFTDEELDIAEKSEDGFIGKRMGVDCYLTFNINAI